MKLRRYEHARKIKQAWTIQALWQGERSVKQYKSLQKSFSFNVYKRREIRRAKAEGEKMKQEGGKKEKKEKKRKKKKKERNHPAKFF